MTYILAFEDEKDTIVDVLFKVNGPLPCIDFGGIWKS
jgi:hypothetical protein